MSDTEHWPGFDREKSAQVLVAGGLTDRRARRTRQSLHETLMRLTVERGYDELSVADIAAAANVGRSTFYAHFTDKDDLLRSAMGTLRAALVQEHAAAGIDGTDLDRMLGFSAFMTAHLAEQHVLYRALMRGRAGPILLDLIRHALCDIVRSELAPGSRSANVSLDDELSVQFVVGAYMSVLTWWLDRGAKEPPSAIEAGFRHMALNGLSRTRKA
ncbi:TetR/AcrR family transcriptional regulator [Devosia sp. XJ19-1]|uniref:TetR/AcrR family transcriptional regulator n=1 Tax=Devosia ureilytica TaxID=2952754 RepID=A0A9Q4AQH5_9HYPH|nr:TetR/AcrR family transcriptional regulator [Devosia ureilytica]MCP8884622.1 TetR/AcrR family transcriptional regulator [Devosia ureilytica]MCP8888252.1 TetR/AcrR family transcriptional regulator [Devosia ureilytica]